MNLNINLATRVYINFKQVNLFLTLCFLIGIGWMGFNLYTIASNFEQKKKYTEFLSKKSGGGGITLSDADYNMFLLKIKNANNILSKRSYDWLSLLEKLEQLVPAGVSLSSLQPSDRGETLKFTGMAAGFSSIRKLMENLEGSKIFTEIYLTNQSIAKIDKKRQAINFTISCKALMP